MKLYITPHSPFSRMARMMVMEAGIEDKIEQFVAQTRVVGSPYYEINPSGRVPYLIRDDGTGLEESELICAYLDQVAETQIATVPAGDIGWEYRRLNALARSFTDGISVWLREILRPESDRSVTIIDHEKERCRRLTGLWENEIDCPLMQGPINLPQLTLASGLGLEAWVPDFKWRTECPKLTTWMNRVSARPAMIATRRPEIP